MDAVPLEPPLSSSSSIFSLTNSRIPDDTVFYSIFPDISLHQSSINDQQQNLQSLHLEILNSISPYLTDYIWQHEPFNLFVSSSNPNDNCFCSSQIPHFHGKTRYGDNLEDEWFIVFLFFDISRRFPALSARVWDSDGEFLLIEAAFSLPRWINPENSFNRVFIRRGELHIVPKNRFASNPSLSDSLMYLMSSGDESRASESVQLAMRNRISEYPERARSNMHRVRVRVPVSVAQVLKHEPCLISLAVESFYDRDIDSMKFAARMEKFLAGGSGEELVQVSVRLSRAMYAQLVQQTFQAPKCYPMPPRTDNSAYVEAELGMKIACGFEMMYQQRRNEGLEGKGSTWDTFRQSLESSGYFKGLLPGSKEFRQLMETAQEYYRNSSLFSRTSEMMSAPVKRIDEILALPHSADDFNGLELPPSDDDGWLYNGEDELNSAILERQKEMESYELKHKKTQQARDHKGADQASGAEPYDFDPSNIAKTMQDFVHKVSSYKGAEVPENSGSKDVDLDVDCFIKNIKSVMGQIGQTNLVDYAEDGGSSSDMDFDEFEDESDFSADEDEGNAFMESYSAALNEELKSSTLKKSFLSANEEASRTDNKGKSVVVEEMDEDCSPVDVDVNLVKSLIDSFSSQQGLPGPASNLLGLMGVQLPQDSSKDQ